MATKPAAKTPLKPVPSVSEEAAPAEKKKKSKLLLILPLVLVLLGGGGAGAWFFLHHGKDPEQAEQADKAKEAAAQKPPVFVTLEPFTVNLQGGEHFLQIGLVLQVANDETGETIKSYLPQIRNRLLLLLSSKTPDQLASIEAKHKLADEILSETREPLGAKGGENVQSVLFASMVVQ